MRISSAILYRQLTMTSVGLLAGGRERRSLFLTSAIEEFLHFLSTEKAASANTVAAYRNDLQQLAGYVGGCLTRQVGSRWDAVERETIEDFILALRRRGYKESSVARKVAAARSFFVFLLGEGMIPADPTDGLLLPRVNKISPSGISPEELDQLLEQPAGRGTPEAKRDLAMLELLSATGMRVSELISLDVTDIQLVRQPLVSCPARGAARRRIPIQDGAVAALRLYLVEGRPLLVSGSKKPPLFVNRRGDRLTRQGVWLILKGYARAAGFDREVSPRTLRRSFATRMLRGGMPPAIVQKMLGHANTSTTRVYLNTAG